MIELFCYLSIQNFLPVDVQFSIGSGKQEKKLISAVSGSTHEVYHAKSDTSVMNLTVSWSLTLITNSM